MTSRSLSGATLTGSSTPTMTRGTFSSGIIAADGPLETVPRHPGMPAEEYFSRLATEIVLGNRAIAYGITAFEVISGHAISGGQGTTISQVSEGRSGGSSKPSQAPSTQPSASATSSTEPSSAPSSEPSQSVAPSTEPSTSTEPTTQSSDQANPSTDTRVGAATSSADNQGSGAGSSAAGTSVPGASAR